jgi:hypothetical protein
MTLLSTLRLLSVLFACTLTVFSRARAQAQEEPDLEAGKVLEEEPDPTRLDVSRLPPEAIHITRDLYAQGLFMEAALGAMGFIGDAGDVSKPGPRMAITFGYEFTRWLSVLVLGEGSLHNTKNRPPPAHTVYELAGGALGLRFSIPFNAQAALWAEGIGGFVWSGGDVLRGLGFKNAHKIGMDYGGELGFDWHVRSLHHSLGVLGGARMYPSLARDQSTLGTYGSVYLRYVF